MNAFVKNIMVLLLSLFVCLYLGEFMLGFYLVKSVPRYPLPAHAVQRHVTVDYDVQYRYNNLSLRSADFNPAIEYDFVLLGDSFFFGQGVKEKRTIGDRLHEKGRQVLNVSEIATNPVDYLHKLNIMKAQGLTSSVVIVGLCMGNDFQDIADRNIAPALTHRYRSPFLTYDVRSFVKLERFRYQLRRKGQQFADWIARRHIGRHGIHETVVVHEFEHRRKFDGDWLRFFAGEHSEIISTMSGNRQQPFSHDSLNEAAYLEKIQLTPQSFYNTVRILGAMPSLLPDARFYVVLIPGPHYVWGFRSPRYDEYVARLKEAMAPFFAVIDLHGKMTPAMHFEHDGHWNEQGHRFAADQVLRQFTDVR